MRTLLEHKLKWFRKLNDCPHCGNFRGEVYFPDASYGSGNGQVDDNYLPRAGALASIRFYCGFELAVDGKGEIVKTRACEEIGASKASELDQMAEESFEDGDELEDAA